MKAEQARIEEEKKAEQARALLNFKKSEKARILKEIDIKPAGSSVLVPYNDLKISTDCEIHKLCKIDNLLIENGKDVGFVFGKTKRFKISITVKSGPIWITSYGIRKYDMDYES